MSTRANALPLMLGLTPIVVWLSPGCSCPKVRTHPSLDSRIRNVRHHVSQEDLAPPRLSGAQRTSERMLGNLQSALMLQGSVLLLAPEIEQELAGILSKLCSAASWPAPPRIFVLNSHLAQAWTCPNGDILVTSGLLTVVENPDEMAVVLGHELAHLKYHHGYMKMQDALARRKTTRRVGQIIIGTAAGAGSAVAASLPGYVPISEPLSRALFAQIAGQLLGDLSARLIAHAGTLLAQIALTAQLTKYSQQQEALADRIGVGYAARAGYAAQRGVRIFQKLRDLESRARKGH